MDTAGAVIGISLAYLFFTQYNGDYITVFWLSIIPAVIGVFLLFLVSDNSRQTVQKIKKLTFSWSELDGQLKFFLIVSFFFNLGNSSNQFLLIRAGNIGFSPAEVILLYLGMNVTYLLISYPAGRLSDRLGRRGLLVAGYMIYGLVYIGFAMAASSLMIIILFGIYGLYIGLTEGIEKALLADIAPSQQKASVYITCISNWNSIAACICYCQISLGYIWCSCTFLVWRNARIDSSMCSWEWFKKVS